jgi:hypothetical protein
VSPVPYLCSLLHLHSCQSLVLQECWVGAFLCPGFHQPFSILQICLVTHGIEFLPLASFHFLGTNPWFSSVSRQKNVNSGHKPFCFIILICNYRLELHLLLDSFLKFRMKGIYHGLHPVYSKSWWLLHMSHWSFLQAARPRKIIGIPSFPLLQEVWLHLMSINALTNTTTPYWPQQLSFHLGHSLFLVELARCCHNPAVASLEWYVPPTMVLLGACLR